MSNSCQTAVHGQIGVMWKTVSEDCNLACDYCYYSTCGGKPGAQIRRIEIPVLEKFICEYMAMSRGATSFAWQGGEPLLAGLDFFEQVIALQAKYAPPHTMISNALQTNGTLINDKWASFFKQYHFLLGVSLDGPKDIHDPRRVDSSGQGSFDRVMRGIDHLRKHQVDFNILTVINKGNVGKAKELMAFYKEQDFRFIQFIPCMDFQSQRVDQPGVYEITPEEYGDFLCEVFDIWYNNGHPEFSIRDLDNILSVYAHHQPEQCIHRKHCPKTIIFEQNGDAFPCDFYIHEDWKLGNIGSQSLDELLCNPLYDQFLEIKPRLPKACQSCEWLHLCYGGCPRNRTWNQTQQDQVGVDYFCKTYKRIYNYAHEKMQQLGDSIRKDRFTYGVRAYYKGRPPGRNEACACGSGRKYKHCCAV